MVNRVLNQWQVEDPVFWESRGRAIANRNLWLSILALLLSFAVWMVWSVVVVNLPNIGFRFSTDELFWLAALPALCGATLRMFYAFMVPLFGGRRWTAISTAALLLPTLGIGLAVQDPATPYSTFVLLALLCGLGGGNFASSMANINFFFPKAQKGLALGLNAGLGNLGVSVVQFVVPLIITVDIFGSLGGPPQSWVHFSENKNLWLQNAGYIWAPLLVLAALGAWFGMNDLSSARAPIAEQTLIFRDKHCWLMSWLYLGSFGSFIGYAAGFPLLIKSQFPAVDALAYAFLGPLVGALIRPVGGWISDQLGGANVTLWNFIAMVAAVLGVLYFLPSGTSGGNFYGFLAMFVLLFAMSGIGNGSTFHMIPLTFLTHHQRQARDKGPLAQERAIMHANREAAVVMGFASAVGAYGGFFIPRSFGSSIAQSGGPELALYGFILFYLSCIGVTWWFYQRRNAPMPC
ncbi:MAG: NarK family nitrate/nitrite MFS transporter [Betaproteobacteria bacterium]|nr:NarK family nitrate/nitrite MFS transporter [Betaproteobacteria bacterium]